MIRRRLLLPKTSQERRAASVSIFCCGCLLPLFATDWVVMCFSVAAVLLQHSAADSGRADLRTEVASSLSAINLEIAVPMGGQSAHFA